MKFSLAVAEFNPLHNGHRILIDKMKKGGDAVVIIMSGNFCQRGEAAALDKYTRAAHAVKAGADFVIELPTVFATAPAEIFAKGAIKLLSTIKGEKTLFFGTETGTEDEFIKLAEVMLIESKEFKSALKEQLSGGAPYALARANALKATASGVNFDILDNPNSVLALEYVKAIKSFDSDISIKTVQRSGGYHDDGLNGNICSALAVRTAIAEGNNKKLKRFVPDFVLSDLPEKLPNADEPAIYKLLEADAKSLKEIIDCSEGLENRLKAYADGAKTLLELIDKLETRRYTRARLSRIITANMLGIDKAFTEKCLKSDLYLKILAVNKDKKSLLSELSEGGTTLITRKTDADKLTGVAKNCFEKDVFANSVYNLISCAKTNGFEMKSV